MTKKMTGSSIEAPLRGLVAANGVWGALYEAEIVRITGPDSRRFANGMFTNNVRDLPVEGVNRHAIVDDRGRVGGFLDLVCVADDVFVALLAPGVTAADFCERYATFVVFDDVELEPQAPHRGLHLLGDIERLHLPPAGTATAWGEGWAFRTWGWPGPGVRWVSPAESADSHLPTFEALDERAHAAVEILAGVPRFPDDTGPKALPHELGLRDEMLSFDKGCYLGQEAINRIDVMGKVRKQLRALRGPALAPGAEITLDGAKVGVVGRVATLPEGPLGLSVLKEAAAPPGTVVQIEGETAEVLALPVGPDKVLPSG